MDEDWAVLKHFFPPNWQQLAVETGALKGLRKDKSSDNLLRTLLLHAGCGFSLRETVVRARKATIADLSDVALLKRMRKCKNWLKSLCTSLFEERKIAPLQTQAHIPRIRLFDGTIVKEPGKTGSLWRIHYSVQLPSLECDYFKVTEAKGEDTGESFQQFRIDKGDFVIADRGYSKPDDLRYVESRQAEVIVRVNTGSLPILDRNGRPFPLLEKVEGMKNAGCTKGWEVAARCQDGYMVKGRICAIRKTQKAIEMARDKILTEAKQQKQQPRPETLEFAKYVIIFTNSPESRLSNKEALELYRIRWQVELVFKRFKSILGLGHVPKQNDESSMAWLYGKLFVALLTDKLIGYASSVSPWGCSIDWKEEEKLLA